MKTMKELSMEVAKREGKKVNLTKAQIDEVLAIVSDIDHETCGESSITIAKNGARRARAKRK